MMCLFRSEALPQRGRGGVSVKTNSKGVRQCLSLLNHSRLYAGLNLS